MKRGFLLFFCGIFSALTGCRHAESTAAIRSVQPFEVKRFLGLWHEAARLPHSFEKGMSCVTAEYTLDADGRIRVCNRGIRDGQEKLIRGYARQVVPGTGELEVSFFRPFYGKYRVIALTDNDSAALITSATKDYAWILVRDPAAAKSMLPPLTAKLRTWGFDTKKLIFPPMSKPTTPAGDPDVPTPRSGGR